MISADWSGHTRNVSTCFWVAGKDAKRVVPTRGRVLQLPYPGHSLFCAGGAVYVGFPIHCRVFTVMFGYNASECPVVGGDANPWPRR